MIHWPARAALPAGMRVYMLGEIRGDAALMAERINRVVADMGGRETLPTYLVINGNLIGGPDSAAVILRAMRLEQPFDGVAVLRGPAETALLAALEGDAEAAAHVPDVAATGWGISPWRLAGAEAAARVALLREAVPLTVHHWLLRRPAAGHAGGYGFANGRLLAGRHRIADELVGLEGTTRWVP